MLPPEQRHRARRDDRHQDRGRTLDAAEDAAAAGPPGHEAERQRRGAQIETDARVEEVELEVLTEHERGERDREDDLDGADRDPVATTVPNVKPVRCRGTVPSASTPMVRTLAGVLRLR